MRTKLLTGAGATLGIALLALATAGTTAAPAALAQTESPLAPGDRCREIVASVAITTIEEVLPESIRSGETLYLGEAGGQHVAAPDVPHLVAELMTSFGC